MIRTQKKEKNDIPLEIEFGTPRDIPSTISTDAVLAFNQNQLALERTEFAKIRTDLSLTNSSMSIERTHLSYLRTIVSLLGSAATLYEALPLLGVNQIFSSVLASFLFLVAVYFIYKDATIYPKMKRKLRKMEEFANKLAKDSENQVYRIDDLQIHDEEGLESISD